MVQSQTRSSPARPPVVGIPLATPAPLPALVDRPHLLRLMDQAPFPGLTLVTAPAGFGKTTLLRQWAVACHTPVAWLSLDRWENDPGLLTQALLDSFLAAGLPVSQTVLALAEAQPTGLRAVLSALAGGLTSPCALVLDDYHVITDDQIHQAIAYLVNHLPPTLRVVIAARTAPRLPVARLRLQGGLLRLGPSDLAFSAEETGQLLGKIHGLYVGREEIAGLTRGTGGWPGALQLCALFMKEAPSPVTPERIASERNVAAYLSEEVLERQPRPLQIFLEHASILDAMNPSLAEAVTGQPDAGRLLEDLEASGLVTAVSDAAEDGGGQWHRCNQLLTEFLRSRLRRRQPRLVPELHRRAALWYGRQGLPYQAVEHALLSQDTALLANLVEEHGRVLWMRCEIATLARWLAPIPEATLRSRPRLSLLQAWALTHAGQVEAAETWVRAAEAALRAGTGAGAGEPDDTARGEAAAIRARIGAMVGDVTGTVRWSRRALGLLPEGELNLRGDLHMNIGFALFHRDAKGSAAAFSTAAQLGVEAGNPRTAMLARQYLANVRAGQGRLREAATVLEQATDLAKCSGWERLPAAGFPHVGMAHLLYEWNRLPEALALIEQGLALGEQGGEAKILFNGYLVRARIRAAQGQKQQALADLRRMERVSSWASAETWRVQVKLHMGDTASALAWLRENGFTAGDQPAAEKLPEYLILLQALRLTGRSSEALPLARHLLATTEPTGNRGSLLRVKLHQALLLEAAGHRSDAVATLREVLAEAAPEGWTRLFLDEGKPMASLLELTLRQISGPRDLSAYSTRLLHLMTGVTPQLVEPLSEREEDVLRQLAAGHSNETIARQLFITVGTVKTHVHRIYQKLGVQSRTQAVARGQSLGLL